ncbi:MAG: ABC transporter permease [Armatimonadota bacterium]|nr:ABC transporter permease [Armatimonadota bacterium]MDR5698013.1 ABC transporter permease [Armatimonadota bacterium]
MSTTSVASKSFVAQRADALGRGWYRFSRNVLSVAGLAIVTSIIFAAIFAPYVAPYPHHAAAYVDFSSASQPPSWQHPFGTDRVGRDVLSRVVFGYRSALLMGIVVLALVVPVGVFLGLVAGYLRGSFLDAVIMRTTDVFLSVPPLVLALAMTSLLAPTLLNAMIAVSLMWWPWYTRLVYGMASSLRNEFFVQAAELTGAGRAHILFRELLPNCVSPILTKMTLDMGWVILIGAALSFVGLGEQPPRPALGTMVSEGARYLPDLWWLSLFPGLAIMVVVLGFNLLGDGIRDWLAREEV